MTCSLRKQIDTLCVMRPLILILRWLKHYVSRLTPGGSSSCESCPVFWPILDYVSRPTLGLSWDILSLSLTWLNKLLVEWRRITWWLHNVVENDGDKDKDKDNVWLSKADKWAPLWCVCVHAWYDRLTVCVCVFVFLCIFVHFQCW